MQERLLEIELLLRSYGHSYEANLAAIAARRFEQDPLGTCQALNSEEWWNSNRSLAAIDLAINGGFSARSRRDSQVLRRALIAVFTTMLAYGEHNDSAEIMVSQFRKWLASRV